MVCTQINRNSKNEAERYYAIYVSVTKTLSLILDSTFLTYLPNTHSVKTGGLRVGPELWTLDQGGHTEWPQPDLAGGD